MGERYDIKGRIGQGGVGAVYDAFDTVLNRRVAIKRLLPDDESEVAEGGIGTDLSKEAAILSSLHHPNIVTLYDIAHDEEGAFVVMEMIDGETIEDVVQRGAMTQDDFSIVVEQCLEALVAAQDKSLLHRDLKPTNIMVQWLGNGKFQIKILDFGLAKHSAAPAVQTVDHGGAILGSIYFLAPEQFERVPLDPRTDLYALGCVFYYCLTKRYPFEGDTAPDVMMAHLEHKVQPIEEIRPDLPASLCAWVMRLMSREMESRPADAREAIADYRRILADPAADYNGVPQPTAIATSNSGSASSRLTPSGTTSRRLTKSGSASSKLIMGDAAPDREQVRRSLTSRSVQTSTRPPGSGVIQHPSQTSRSVLVVSEAQPKKPPVLWIAIGGGVIVLLVVLGIILFGGDNPDDHGPSQSGGLTADGLPADGLVAHYSGWEGVITKNTNEADVGDFVWEWRDQASFMGSSPLKIEKKSGSESPEMVEANPQSIPAIKGPTPALKFSPGNSLSVDLSGQTASASTWENGLTLTMVLKSPDPNNGVPIRFFSDGSESGRLACSGAEHYEGIIRLEEKEPGFSRVKANKGGLVIITAVWNRKEGHQRLYSRLPAEKPEDKRRSGQRIRKEGGPDSLEKWVVGTWGTGPDKTQYTGEIFEIAIYNRALEDTEVSTLEEALANRYFAKP